MFTYIQIHNLEEEKKKRERGEKLLRIRSFEDPQPGFMHAFSQIILPFHRDGNSVVPSSTLLQNF